MIISYLNHLEVVSEASSVVGGTTKNYYNKRLNVRVNVNAINNNQKNVSYINQEQNVKAIAVAGKFSDATAIAVGGDQTAIVDQANKASAQL